MTHKLIIYCLILLSLSCANNTQKYKIDAKTDVPFSGKVYLTTIRDSLVKIDSLTIENSSEFSFSGDITQPDMYRILSSPYLLDISLCLEPGGKYELKIGKEETKINVFSGKEQEILNGYLEKMKSFEAKDEMLQQQFEESDAEKHEEIQQQILQLLHERDKANMLFIQSQPKSMASILAANNLLLADFQQLKEVYSLMDTVNYSNSYYLKDFLSNYHKIASKWIEGTLAPSFTTTDIKGNEVSLSDFKGHYVLLDFWASWCAPCRKKAKELKKIIDKLDRKGIKIIGISMDDDREKWMKASEEDAIIWTNTCESKNLTENPIASAYKVERLPTLFLLNPEGLIIKQNPTIEELLQLKNIK